MLTYCVIKELDFLSPSPYKLHIFYFREFTSMKENLMVGQWVEGIQLLMYRIRD